MAMKSTISFQIPNSGMQTGINNGTINALFNLHADPLDKLPIANGAEFDSYMNQHEDECLTGTRTELLNEIAKWAVSPQGKCIFWLNGMAGTGKSTISRTVAKRFKQEKILGASFFFKRGERDRGNATKLFPTITRRLAASIPDLEPSIRKAVYDDPDIATRSLREQFDKLLIRPLLSLEQVTAQISMVIVIDALDECEIDNDVRVILQLLPQVQELSAIRLRIFLTSRPELPIRLGFSKIANHKYQDLALHNIPEAMTAHDISLFLKDRFTQIRDVRDVPIGWPGDDEIRALVTMSVPLFISAATLCRFIEAKLDPVECLTDLLEDQAKYATKMEKTYLPVLTRLLNDQDDDDAKQLLHHFRQIIGVIILLAAPLSINALSRLLGVQARVINNLLDSFRSVLSLPSDRDLPVRILHLSFRDFLVQTRSKFYVDMEYTHKEIALYCVAAMRSLLKRNVCNLPGYGIQKRDIDKQTIHQHLLPELQYACRYWAHHLLQCTDLNAAVHDAYLFLQRHFLHWVEAMSLLGLASEVVGSINLLLTVKSCDNHSAISEFLHDAKRFILKNRQIAEDAPLQLYCSGLIFAPQKAIIRKEFEAELPNWILRLPQVEETWSSELQTIEGHSNWVQSVAFSPDGRLLASGSSDTTVRLWDTATSALQNTLEGHTDWVESVAFSTDGRLLASGSRDRTVRLWDTTTGALQHTLEGHSGRVPSVAFSPDGRLLASGSYDKTVQLWDTTTGALQQTLQGYSDWVNSVAFSPDGRLLAFGFRDRTVRLWDTTTGALQQTLEGHSNFVKSVAFSPHGRLLASGSGDKTVRLWDTTTSTLQQTLEGHLGSVDSVAFSNDGRLLASGSRDKTVRLWDTATGALQQTLEGHSDRVWSVAFSPDGRLLASGSYDKTVRLWDPVTSAVQQTLEGHSDWVQSMAFSPDGRLLASGSEDKTVRLWDTTTSTLQQTLEGHLGSVDSVAFSTDSRLLASGSYDKTVRLWDTATGSVQQTLKGHSSRVYSVAFSPDGRLLASSSYDKTARLWDTTTGALQQTLEGHSMFVKSVAFSPDGRLLASGSGDMTVRLWDTTTGALQQTLEGHPGWTQSPVAFSPDGRLLASGSSDKRVRLWDTATGALHETLSIDGVVTDLKFSQDGSYLGTNLGFIDIQSQCGNHISNSPQVNLGISTERGQWIILNGEKVLWIPPEARFLCSAIKDSTIVLGHASGRISFIGFRV